MSDRGLQITAQVERLRGVGECGIADEINRVRYRNQHYTSIEEDGIAIKRELGL